MHTPSQSSFLLGLFGQHILASRSPRLHETEARAQGIALVYRLFDFTELPSDMAALGKMLELVQKLGFDGLNITYPYKTDVVQLLDELSPEAAALGAVNTVVLRHGKRVGHNTDWSGFAANMRHGLPDADLGNVVQLGAGGAGSATAYALLHMGARQLHIHDIDTARATLLVDKMRKLFPQREIAVVSDLAAVMRAATGLVQTTPVGMLKHAGTPISPQLLKPELWLADIVYAPAVTEIAAHARQLGCRTINGIGMVAFQGADAFKLFTDIEPDRQRMLHSLLTAEAS